jgi:large subunit ribosomal protein L44
MTPTKPAVLHTDALSSIPRALVALIYQNRSLPSTRQFVHSFFLNREVDLRSLIKFRDPKRALTFTVAKFKRERPKSRYAFGTESLVITYMSDRLLKETGRFSQSPIFVVGIYSGTDKLGEGFGSSLKMAEFRVGLFPCPCPHILTPYKIIRQRKILSIGST